MKCKVLVMFNLIKEKLVRGSERTVIVKKNIMASLFIKGISIIISLLLVPITLGYVSNEMYGIWLTLSSVMLWLNFFDVGFTLGLKNKLAEAIALGEWNRGKMLVSTTYLMMFIIFVPLCAVLELCVPLINWSAFLNVNPIYNNEITNTLYVLVAFFCVQMISNVLSAVAAAFQKVAFSSLFPVIGNIMSLIIIWVLTKFCPPSLVSLAFAISAMPVIVLVTASIFLYSNQFHKVSPNLKTINIHYVKDLFSLGARFFLIQIQFVVLYQCTNVLISNVSGPQEVTSYNIAYKYLNVGMMVFSIVLAPLWPAFTDAYTQKDFSWMQRVYRKMLQFYTISVFVMFLMLAVSPLVYQLWIGDKADISWLLTSLVCLYMIVHNWDSLQVNLINGVGTVKLQTYVTLIGLILHIPLSFFLGNNCNMGAIGVVLSMIVINIIYSIFFTIQINKILRQKAKGIWLA